MNNGPQGLNGAYRVNCVGERVWFFRNVDRSRADNSIRNARKRNLSSFNGNIYLPVLFAVIRGLANTFPNGLGQRVLIVRTKRVRFFTRIRVHVEFEQKR